MHVAIASILVAFFVAIGPMNKYVFKKVSIEEIRRQGRERISAAQQLLTDQKYQSARDSLNAIADEFGKGKDPISRFVAQTALYTIGTSYQSEWLYDESIRAMNKLVKEYPETPYAEYVFYTNGQSFIKIENYRAAIDELEKIEKNRAVAQEFPKYKAIQLKPETYINVDKLGDPRKKKRKARVYTLEMQRLEAKGKTEEDEERKHLLSDVVIEIGRCYIHLNETKKARQQFALIRKFFQDSDQLDDAQKLISDSYLLDGDIAAAQTKKAGSDAEKERFEARARVNYERAVNAYQRFVNTYTQSNLVSDVYIRLGDGYYKLGENEKAEFAFERAIHVTKQPEKQAKVQLNIGNYFESEKRYDQAIDAYAKVLQNYSKSRVAGNAVYMTGICYEQKQDTAKAIEYLGNLCDFYKSSKFYGSAAYKLGLHYVKLQDDKKALKYLRSGVQLSQGDHQLASQTQFQIGTLFKTRKEYEVAIEEFQYVVDNYEGEWSSKALFQMVDCYKRLGNMELAKKTAERIKDNHELIIESYKLLGLGVATPEEELKLWEQKVAEAVDDKARVASLMEVARLQLYKLKQYDQAKANYEKILELTTDAVRKINAQVGIAQVHMSQKEFTKAREIFEEILENPKTSDQVKVQIEYKILDSHRQEKNYDKALDGLKVFVEQYRANDLAPYAQFAMGLCYSEQKKHDEAIAEYNRVLEEFNKSDVVGQAILAIGSAYRGQKLFDKAIQYWKDALRDHPGISETPTLNFHIGSTLKEDKKDCASSLAYLQTVVDNFVDSPLFSTSAYLLGECHQKMGKDKLAIEAYDQVKNEDKDVRRAADAEIGRLLGKTDPQAAIASYERIITNAETDLERAIAEMGKGDILTGMKKYKDAAESYHRIYAEYTGANDTMRGGALVKEIDAYNQLAARKKSYFKTVISLSDQMIKEFPENPYMINAVYFKASAYYTTNRYTQARRVFQQIIKLDKSPEITEVAFYQKADCLLFAQKYQSAIREYGQYLKRYPKGKYRCISRYQIGNSHWAQENYRKAKTNYQKVVSGCPKFSELCSAKGFLGYCLDQLGQWREARKLYQSVVRTRKCRGEARKFAEEQLEANITAH